MKEPIVREIEVCHKRERDTHVLRMGQPHERIMALTMFRNLHTKHCGQTVHLPESQSTAL